MPPCALPALVARCSPSQAAQHPLSTTARGCAAQELLPQASWCLGASLRCLCTSWILGLTEKRAHNVPGRVLSWGGRLWGRLAW